MELIRYVRIGVLTGIFAIPFVVLLVAQSLYFPFITGKGFVFRILVEICFALWVVLALYSPEYRPKKSLALWLGLAFVVSVGVSTVFAANPTKAFWSNFERMEGYITILHLAAYVVVLTTVLNTEKLWRNLVYTTLGVATLVGIYSVFQLLGAFTINQGGLRIDATLGNATYFAVYMLVHAFLALYAYVRWTGDSRWLRIALGTLFALFSILIFYSATRGSILGLFGGLGLAGLILIASRSVSSTVRYVGISIVAVIIVLAGLFYAVKDTAYVQTHPILSRIATISLNSGATRFTIWSMALEGAKERPLFGWGQEGFNYVFNKYYRSELVSQEPWFDRAHNVVLDWLVAGGIIGMLLYLSLYVVLVYYLWKPGSVFDAHERALLTGLLAAYIFHNIFVFDNLLSYVLFMMLFAYITFRAQAARPPAVGTEIMAPEVSAPIALVALLVVMYLANWPGYASASGIIQGLSPHQEGVTKNLEYFVAASGRTGLGYQEVGEQFLQFAVQVKGLNVGDQAFQSSVVQASRRAFDGVLTQAPNDARLLVFYGSFLRQLGDTAAARTHIEHAVALSPLKQSILIEYGLLEMSESKYDAAIAHFTEVYKTAERYSGVYTLIANAAILSGKTQLAHDILVKFYGDDVPEDTSVANAYLRSGNYAKAVHIAELIAEHNPSVDSYKFLAGVYIQGKEKDKAIAALTRAKQIDPQFGPEADTYIKNLREGTL